MSQKNEIDDLLERYLRGECSPEEERLIGQWYDRLNVSARDLLRDDPEFARRAELQLRQKIEALKPPRAVPLFRRKYLVWSAAASVAGLLLISWLFLNKGRADRREQAALVSLTAGRNQLKRVSLPDGSIVWINQFTHLEWASAFTDSVRLVRLTGEARFQIASDPGRPFIVQTGNTYTKVLGTEFVVEAYPDEKDIRVSLLTGKVQFGEAQGKTLATLQPGYMASYTPADHSCQVSPIVCPEVDGWTTGAIVFNEVSLKDALHRLALRYDWQLLWKNKDDKRLSAATVTGVFRRETPQQILAGIAFTHKLNYQLKNNQLIIY